MSINLYTNIFSSSTLPERWEILATSAATTFISALFWSAIAWELDGIQKLAISDSPDWFETEELMIRLASQKKFRLILFYLVSIVTAILGLGILLLDFDFRVFSKTTLEPTVTTVSTPSSDFNYPPPYTPSNYNY